MGGASPSPQHSPQYSPSQDNSIEMVALIAEGGQGGEGDKVFAPKSNKQLTI